MRFNVSSDQGSCVAFIIDTNNSVVLRSTSFLDRSVQAAMEGDFVAHVKHGEIKVSLLVTKDGAPWKTTFGPSFDRLIQEHVLPKFMAYLKQHPKIEELLLKNGNALPIGYGNVGGIGNRGFHNIEKFQKAIPMSTFETIDIFGSRLAEPGLFARARAVCVTPCELTELLGHKVRFDVHHERNIFLFYNRDGVWKRVDNRDLIRDASSVATSSDSMVAVVASHRNGRFDFAYATKPIYADIWNAGGRGFVASFTMDCDDTFFSRLASVFKSEFPEQFVGAIPDDVVSRHVTISTVDGVVLASFPHPKLVGEGTCHAVDLRTITGHFLAGFQLDHKGLSNFKNVWEEWHGSLIVTDHVLV